MGDDVSEIPLPPSSEEYLQNFPTSSESFDQAQYEYYWNWYSRYYDYYGAPYQYYDHHQQNSSSEFFHYNHWTPASPSSSSCSFQESDSGRQLVFFFPRGSPNLDYDAMVPNGYYGHNCPAPGGTPYHPQGYGQFPRAPYGSSAHNWDAERERSRLKYKRYRQKRSDEKREARIRANSGDVGDSDDVEVSLEKVAIKMELPEDVENPEYRNLKAPKDAEVFKNESSKTPDSCEGVTVKSPEDVDVKKDSEDVESIVQDFGALDIKNEDSLDSDDNSQNDENHPTTMSQWLRQAMQNLSL